MKVLFVWLVAICCFIPCGAQNYQTYTLYIHGFSKYVQWPEEYRTGDFEIVVLGDSPIFGELQKMAEKKKLGDRSIKILKIKSVGEFKKSQMLFVSTEQLGLLNEVFAKIGTKPTLIVTDQSGVGIKGSDINFITKDGKLAFELNQKAMNKHNLKASSELIKLAILI
jgi:YfiR/HmsC-like